MTTLTPEVLKGLRDEAEEYVRLGGFTNAAAWIQECPPSTVLALLDRIEALESSLDQALDRHMAEKARRQNAEEALR